ncbi:MAG: SpoVT / AbrB like domain protein [bacterium ADurb.Bin429]|nr:MAG: SpoVT / AbrB like domain protein [bacterium ADurb.Bin429]
MKVTSGGRVTIPAKIRQRYILLPGSEVDFIIDGSAI